MHRMASAAILAIFAIGCAAKPTVPQLLEEARRHLQQGEAAGALLVLDAAARLDAGNAEIFILRSAAFLMEQEPELAIRECNAAIALDPKRAAPYVNRGEAWRQLSDHSQAIRDLGLAIEVDPRHATAYQNRANIWAEQRDYEKSIADLDRVLELEPRAVDALLGRSGNLGRYAEAERDLSAAMEIAPDDASKYFQRGFWRTAQEKWAAALEDFQEAIRLQPEHDLAHQSIAMILAGNSPELLDPTMALHHARRACELTDWKASSPLQTLAMAHEAAGNVADAIAFHQRAIETASKGFDVNRAREVLQAYQEANSQQH